MSNKEVIDQSKLSIEKQFNSILSTWRKDAFLSNFNFVLSSESLINEFQLLDTTLSIYFTGENKLDEEGIDLSISICECVNTVGNSTTFSSQIKFDDAGDIAFGNSLFVVSDITTSTGEFLFKNRIMEITTNTAETILDQITSALTEIFASFKLKQNLISSRLELMKSQM